MEKEMEKEKNIIIKMQYYKINTQYSKVNIQKEKEMEKE